MPTRDCTNSAARAPRGLSRRRWLKAAASAALAGALPRIAAGQDASAPLAAADLRDGLLVLSGAGANILCAASSDRLMLVDGGSREAAPRVLERLAERWPGRKVDLLFHTNWREEHTGGNETFAAAGAAIMAHENTKLWLGADFFVEWEGRRHAARPARALPTKTYYTSGADVLGGRKVDYHHLPRAHTDGDTAVFLPDANVLAASDLLAIGAYPIVDYATGGWIGGLEEATRALLAIVDAETRIVPAAGPASGRAALEDQLELCTAVRERVADAFRRGMSFTDFAASEPTREFDAARGDPLEFLALVYEGAWAHVRELGGII